MADKFGRKYELRIASEVGGNFDITIKLPFTLDFDITRNNLSSAGVGQFRVYNLNENTRSKLRHDQCDYGGFRGMELRAGYGDDPKNFTTIFNGNITTASSVREGTNFITTLECLDGGFAYVNGIIEGLNPFPAGTTYREVILAIATKCLPKITVGYIGNYPDKLTRTTTFFGSTMYVLSQLTNGGAYIDSGKFYALGANEFVPGLSSVGVINAQTGLLNTPVLQNNILHFEMLFEPGLQIGQNILLESLTAPKASTIASENSLSKRNYNGFWKITAVKHRGTISDAICGTATTEASLFFVGGLV